MSDRCDNCGASLTIHGPEFCDLCEQDADDEYAAISRNDTGGELLAMDEWIAAALTEEPTDG